MIPPLMPGVKIGLNELHRTGARILVLTEGYRDRVLRTAQAHGIMTMIDRVIESKKHRRFFARILKLVGNPSNVVMIGDQITKDILPAKEAGLFTIYIQGRFQPKWEAKNNEGIADIQLDSFAKVPYAVAHLLFKDTDIKPKISC